MIQSTVQDLASTPKCFYSCGLPFFGRSVMLNSVEYGIQDHWEYLKKDVIPLYM